MMSNGFSYDDNAGKKTITQFGIEWDYHFFYNESDNFSYVSLVKPEFGELIISKNALDRIKDTDYYKVLSLLLEQKLNNNIYCVTMKNEKDKLQFRDFNYIPLSIDEFFNRFPSNILEKQHRSLLLLYKFYPEYGQQIGNVNQYMFFSKNENEWRFLYSSMVKKKWITAGVNENGINDPFFVPYTITADGWGEIEKIIRNNTKKQVFIAMKFKGMDTIYDTIYKAIDDTLLIPLRIDKKEHINQISSEIQYEISQSGLVVADVTGQNQGVYFEAGYAMGLNIPVIWTCNEKEINDIHFDIRQYNTILWKDESDLYERLKKRITAVMGLREKGTSL